MPVDSEGKTPSKHFEPSWSEIKARQAGELTRGSSHWDVLLETATDAELEAIRGRIHFISGNLHRLSGWIFLEWSEKEIEARFSGFSAQDLWNLLKSLGGD
jgi:hypothetical protein